MVDVADMSRSLAEDSKKYKWGAKKLSLTVRNLPAALDGPYASLMFSLQALYKQYLPLIAVALLAIIGLVLRFTVW